MKPQKQGGGRNKHRGGGSPAPLGPAPAGFLDEILRGQYASPARPALQRAFNVHWGPEFDGAVITQALDSVVNLTGGQVGFVVAPRPIEIEFAYNPLDPYAGASHNAIAVTYREISAGVLTAARIVFGQGWWLDSRTGRRVIYEGQEVYWPHSLHVARHELGHVLGFGHVSQPWLDQAHAEMVMGGSGVLHREWHQWEREAWQARAGEASAQVAQASREGWSAVVCTADTFGVSP